MTQPLVVIPVGPSAARLTRALRVGGRDAVLVVVVEVWGAGGERADVEARLAGGIATVFERRSGSTTTRLKAALEAADRWLRRIAAAAEEVPAGGGLGAGVSVLVLAGEEAILAQVGPAVAYARPVDPGAPARPEPARHPTTSPWLRRGLEALAPQPLWSPLGMGGGTQGDGTELDLHWAHWWMAPGSSALIATTPAALVLSREVVGPLLATPPDRIAAALSATLPADLPAVYIAQREAVGPRPVAAPAAAAASPDSTPAGPGSAPAKPGLASAGPTAAPATPGAIAAESGSPPVPAAAPRETFAGSPPDLTGEAPDGELATPAAARPGLPHPDIAVAWHALRETARGAVVGGARLGARVLLALLPTRSGAGASGYQADWARFAAVAAILLPLALVALALVMRARALSGDLAP